MGLIVQSVICILLMVGSAVGQQPFGPPSPPPPPRFMEMKGLPAQCFDKPNFEQDGLEFFVCNGGGGISGVRRKDDPAHIVLVRDGEIAQNLNMQAAKRECGRRYPGGTKLFGVKADVSGAISFLCKGEDIKLREVFQVASKSDWKKYERYLN